jgi:hypothetical protein
MRKAVIARIQRLASDDDCARELLMDHSFLNDSAGSTGSTIPTRGCTKNMRASNNTYEDEGKQGTPFGRDYAVPRACSQTTSSYTNRLLSSGTAKKGSLVGLRLDEQTILSASVRR